MSLKCLIAKKAETLYEKKTQFSMNLSDTQPVEGSLVVLFVYDRRRENKGSGHGEVTSNLSFLHSSRVDNICLRRPS